jgi:hypothetical protein
LVPNCEGLQSSNVNDVIDVIDNVIGNADVSAEMMQQSLMLISLEIASPSETEVGVKAD